MISGNKYLEIAKEYFTFLMIEFNFQIFEEKIRGNVFYDIQYKDKTRVISISYENIENYLLVIIFILKNGALPNYDDKTKTLHLNRLNEIILSKVDKSEISMNNEYFTMYLPKDEFERKLLKSAKELRICMKHFDELKII